MQPEARDVKAAWKLAIASLRDYERCCSEFGRNSNEARTAWQCYKSDEEHWLETVRAYNQVPDEVQQE
jgi:hypothetical protein